MRKIGVRHVIGQGIEKRRQPTIGIVVVTHQQTMQMIQCQQLLGILGAGQLVLQELQRFGVLKFRIAGSIKAGLAFCFFPAVAG